ncbi:MAG: hypothetical protein ABIF77_17070 [bacterium]
MDHIDPQVQLTLVGGNPGECGGWTSQNEVVFGVDITDGDLRSLEYTLALAESASLNDSIPDSSALIDATEYTLLNCAGCGEDCSSVELLDTVSFTLSSGYGKKLIYYQVVDCAGSKSAINSCHVVYDRGDHAYPNPFNPLESVPLNFVFRCDGDQEVIIRIFDLFGQLVWETSFQAVDGLNDGGWNNTAAQWDGSNLKQGSTSDFRVAEGGYVCLIEHDGQKPTPIKIAVVK